MTPLDRLVVHEAPLSIEAAERVMVDRKIKKLPLVDKNGVLAGLITAKDIIKQKRLPFATRDEQGRLPRRRRHRCDRRLSRTRRGIDQRRCGCDRD